MYGTQRVSEAGSSAATDMEMSHSPVSNGNGCDAMASSSTWATVSSSTVPSTCGTMMLDISGYAATGVLAASSSTDSIIAGPPPPPPPPPDPSMLFNFMTQYPQFNFGHGSGSTELLIPPPVSLASIPMLSDGSIAFKGAVLYPPHSSTQQSADYPPVYSGHPRRERPPYCCTIFIGGVPEKCSEELLRSIFETCGEIKSIRMKSNKNFAHVRFKASESVDRALHFTGYRIRINDRAEKEWSGKLHIDFAQDRFDKIDWENRQRELREAKREPSPPRTAIFTEYEAGLVLERLKSVESFPTSVETLITWLERGDCSKRNCSVFYSMVGAVNANMRRLSGERNVVVMEMNAFREKHKQRLQTIMTQLEAMRRVFVAVRKQKNWDQFTKAQRKNLETWLKQIEELRRQHEIEMLRDRQEEEMETSDGEDSGDEQNPKRGKIEDRRDEILKAVQAENSLLLAQMDALKREHESCRERSVSHSACRVVVLDDDPITIKDDDDEASANSVTPPTMTLDTTVMPTSASVTASAVTSASCLVDSPSGATDAVKLEVRSPSVDHIVEAQALRSSLQSLQEKLDTTMTTLKKKEDEIVQLKASTMMVPAPVMTSKATETSLSDGRTSKHRLPSSSSRSGSSHNGSSIPNETRVISLVSIFLHTHPFGASVEYIQSFLQCIIPGIRTIDITCVLESYPSLFKLKVTGVGASIERSWSFIGYDKTNNNSNNNNSNKAK